MTFKKVFSDLEKIISKADHASLEGEFAFQCCVTGDGEGTFYIAFKDGTLSVEPYDYKGATATFKASADTYKSVLGGEMTASDAIGKGLLAVEDNEDGCANILTFLSGKDGEKKAPAKTRAKKTEEKPATKAPAKTATKIEKPAVKAVEAKPVAKAAERKTEPAKKPGRKKAVK
ncbi:MAG: SCP2 sterol-binding domain-containing protein [Bacteroides sp.]|nr:SCP2 sterol-binding domain-containing protein [Eubacterium sp.]MCM1418239.1 SCP2 sterol-binding domain-containing protein [Roseburia sp.]MCM1462379.1 SCP2 sterol-binding domain-containing protein [Bacteroides sp.]